MFLDAFIPFLYRTKKIVGNKYLVIFFYCLLIFAFTCLFIWVIANDGQNKTDDYSHSTVVLKSQEAILTNYSESDFNTTYVKPNEFENYNRVWDRTDFVTVFPQQIEFITNLVITANQTRGKCPDNPLIKKVSCRPENNTCKQLKGTPSSNGIRTGECVKADFPLNYYHQNNTGHACEVIGWCPVDRMLVPLNNYRPILVATINSTLYIDNSVEFPNQGQTINNLLQKYCRYHPTKNPDCPIFTLGDIIKFTENTHGQSYEEMAKFGATIDINIEWKCHLTFFSSSIADCKPTYSFRRADIWGNRSQMIYDTQAYFDSNGYKRTYIKSYKIKFAVNVKASITQFNFFKFSVAFLSWATAVWTVVCIAYRKVVKKIYPDIGTEEEVNASDLQFTFNWFTCNNPVIELDDLSNESDSLIHNRVNH